jgi:drug/metabolite transporter (DMT)-like permease
VTAFALLLILIAAFLHATWNLCAKRAGGGLPFVWLVGVVICLLYLPVLAGYWLWKHPALTAQQFAWIAGSGVLKTGYSLFLQRSYRAGDFSLIYPLARGTGPLLSTVAAIAILGERPSGLAVAGGLVIIAAIFFLTGGFTAFASLFRKTFSSAAPPPAGDVDPVRPQVLRAIKYGVASGVFIASYTLWDRHGVHALAVPPVIYDGGTAFMIFGLLTPFALRRREEIARHWREHKPFVFGMALFAPTAYVLVLTAMSFTPVSYVAPAREISIAIGAFLGARYLNEADARRRIWAAVGMAAGVIALALG